MRVTKRTITVIFFSIALMVPLSPLVVHAESTGELSITPVVVDEKAKVRDILKESITLTNKSDHKLTLYPAVNNILSQDGEQDFTSSPGHEDEIHSLANWIELSRGVISLGPGEERTIPFVIRVNPNAVPGAYHAVLSFSDGSTRDQAEAKGSIGTVTVNVEIQADIKEVMQLNKFTTDNVVFSGDDVLFTYQLQNIGNQELQPKGEIRIYNRRGEEVASVDVNADNKTVSPDQVTQLASVWSAVNGFGKYKALLNVDYGKSQMASVQDTVYFWVIPWKQLLGISIVGLIIVIFLALYFHRWLEERHLSKLAMAGLLKIEDMAHLPHAVPPMEIRHIPAPPPPVEVHEPAPPRRSIFSFFKRSSAVAYAEPAPVRESPVAVAPAASAPRPSLRESFAPRGEHQVESKPVDDFRFRPAPAPAPAARPQGGTIDLKQMCQPAPKEVPTEAHVIDLKRL